MLTAVLLAVATSTLAPDSMASDKVEFNRHIRPILSENCFACHGPDKNARKAGLRLDRRDDAVAVIEGRRPIVPGNSAESELAKRVTHADMDERMPPAKTNKELTPAQIALLKRWIDEGAEFQPHWSYIPPVRPAVPSPSSTAEGSGFTIRNPIDAFVLKGLEKRKWSPAQAADPHTLIRRLHLDVAGLPPRPDTAEAFAANANEAGYEKQVDDLLASHHFGERIAIGWLDLVRYADTVGYHGDQNVSVSPYRDYVINAFNSNKPFDQFTREQLAGDLLAANEAPGPRKTEWLVASGYNRLNMTTEEGGSQAKEYLVKYMTDRVRTTATTWLGATLGCAQCHDHKFDPFTSRDFYTFGAFFSDIDEIGVYGGSGHRPPVMAVPRDDEAARLVEIERNITLAERDLENDVSRLTESQKKWEAETVAALSDETPRDFVWLEDEVPAGATSSAGWNAINAGQGSVFSGQRAWRQEAVGTAQHFFNKAKTTIPLAAGDAFYVYVFLDAKAPPKALMLQAHSAAHGGWDHRAYWGEDKIAFGGIGTATPQHRHAGPLPETGKWARLEIAAEQLGFSPGQTIDGFSFDQFDGLVFWDQAGVKTKQPALKEKSLSDPVLAALKTPTAERNDAQRKSVRAHFAAVAPELAPLRNRIGKFRAQKEAIVSNATKTLITVAVPPRLTRVLPRGNWMDESGALVDPAVPAFLNPKSEVQNPKSTRLTRLDLSNWLLAPDNPLTARVFVNRLWKQFFGIGLSKQLDELGSQGEWPLHPELLDWLAVEFRESGWNVKHLVKLIVMSTTYRQSSVLSQSQIAAGQTYEADPENRWLGRQSRFRLDAEMVRDNALAVSGLLVDKVGGVSAKPYQPPGYYAQLNFPTREYEPDRNANQWRRGVYMHWQRTFLHPMLLAFDAPSRDECTANRVISNTPLQALVLLNDPTFVEAARAFAARILKESKSGEVEGRLHWAFQAAVGRPPRREEITILGAMLETSLARFRAEPAAAGEFLKVGMQPLPNGILEPELAAWTSVARAILNLHAAVTRS
ncbi:MAG: PSD1 and planctomycete cytochrome C domain-containing protein [Verrucomicrobiales bacterium]